MNPIKYRPDNPSPECDERLYWHKRFTFASWLFLIMGIWVIFASSTPWSAMIGIGVSLGFRILDSVCQMRHIIWHMKGDGDTHV